MANNSYYAKSYEDWKKKWGVNAGERVEGMTDSDYALGMYLQGQDEQNTYADKQYNSSMNVLNKTYEASKNNLNEQYNSSISQLDANRKTSEQNADILHQKMQKYLGTQADAAGLSNTGYGSAESLKLRANAAYNQNLGNIAENYNANKTSLDNQKASSLTDLENAYMTSAEKAESAKTESEANLAASRTNYLLDMYNDEVKANKAEENEIEAKKKATYDDYLAKGNSALTSMTGQESLDYIESIKGSLRAEDYDALFAMAKSKIAQEAKDAEDKAESEKEAEQLQYYNYGINTLDYMTGTEAMAYIESIKDYVSESQYATLKALAGSIINKESAAADDDSAADDKDKKLEAYNTFKSNVGYGYFNTTEEALAWAKENGLENYADVAAIASLIDKNNADKAATEEENAKIAAYNEAVSILETETNADDAWALLDSYKGKITDAQYQLLENTILGYFGERGAMTVDKFKGGAAIGDYVYSRDVMDGEMTEYTKNDRQPFVKALKSAYNTSNPYDSGLKDGSVVTFETDNKGLFTGKTSHTLMYYGGVWYEVTKKPTEFINVGKNNYDYWSKYFE